MILDNGCGAEEGWDGVEFVFLPNRKIRGLNHRVMTGIHCGE